MWDPQRLTTLWAFTACYRDSFTFYFYPWIENLQNLVTFGLENWNVIVKNHQSKRCLSAWNVCVFVSVYAWVPISKWCRMQQDSLIMACYSSFCLEETKREHKISLFPTGRSPCMNSIQISSGYESHVKPIIKLTPRCYSVQFPGIDMGPMNSKQNFPW
jgi:hypothetical protein